MADRAPNSEKPLAVPWERVERFVSQVTHDVRNGLNALELQLTYLGEICVDPEAAEETRRLRSSLADLTRQLQALRTSIGAPSLHPMDYPAQDFFADLRERLERTDGPVAVTWKIAVGTAALAVDPELTMTALLELLGNAAQFGGAAAPVTFSAAEHGANVRVTLTEPAPVPVSTERWGHEPLLTTRRGAYGLGLFRATRILEAQGGSISAVWTANTLTTSLSLPTAAIAA